MPQFPALPLLQLLLPLLLLGLSACSSQETIDQAEAIQVVGGKGLPRLADAGQALSFTGLIGQLLQEDVIFIGEIHSEYGHQRMQLALLEALHRRKVKLAIGVEWIQRPFQQHLDDFIADRIDEAEMLRRTQYFSRWGHDYRHYRPIVQFAKREGLPLIALNAPSELIQAIMQGGLKGLDDFYVAQLPEEYYFTNETYKQRLQRIYARHQGIKGSFGNFYEVQLTWDETMAEQVTRFLENDSETTLVVLAGVGHLEYGHGIPDRVERRTELLGKTLLPALDGELDPQLADFLLSAPQTHLPPIGQLGVELRHTPQQSVVVEIDPKGPAHRAGLRKGDRILKLDQQPIQDLTDLKLALLDKPPGTQVSLVVAAEAQDSPSRLLQLTLGKPTQRKKAQL
ncbi:MAG: ChaN family lipoprotein [Gammaproteobacteria bacterium SHHR-1]